MKVVGDEIVLTTANTVSNARLVKLTIITGNAIITSSASGNTTFGVGTFYYEKDAAETLAVTGAAVLATPAAFTN
tara:strand:- start:863 stop:1087 length:225 start_codon:yes stop_codon:yes gene_type:complete